MRSIPLTTCCKAFASTLRTDRTNLFGTAMPVKKKNKKIDNKKINKKALAPTLRTDRTNLSLVYECMYV
jgi:hypothetical protein